MDGYERIQNEFFRGVQGIQFQPDLEGQKVLDGIVYVGDRAGPDRDVSNLVHEMCHFVEIDDARMSQHRWGLNFCEVWVYDRYCQEPTTMSMTARELRVATFQKNVLDYLGEDVPIVELVSSFRYISDSFHVPLEDGVLAYREGFVEERYQHHRSLDDSRLIWMTRWVQEHLHEYSFERFRQEWDRKTDLLDRALTQNRLANTEQPSLSG